MAGICFSTCAIVYESFILVTKGFMLVLRNPWVSPVGGDVNIIPAKYVNIIQQ